MALKRKPASNAASKKPPASKRRRKSNEEPLPERGVNGTKAPRQLPPLAPGGRRRKSIEEMAAEQGITLPQDYDALVGIGKDWWASDEEFEAWLAALQERRRTGG